MSFEKRCGTGSERRKTWKRECRSNFFQGVPPSPIYAPVIRSRHTFPSYVHVMRRLSWCNMLPSCNPCCRHASIAVPRGTDVRGWAMLPASGPPDARRVYHGPGPGGPGAGAGPRARRRGRTIPARGIDAGYRRGGGGGGGGRTIPAGAGRYQRGRGPGLAGGGERSPAAPGGGKRSPAASGPLDPDLYYGVTLLFSGGGIGIDTDRTRKISIERGCYGTRHRTLSGSAAGRPRTPPARGGSRPLSFMSWSVRRGPRAFRSGRTFGSRSFETESPIGRPLILKEW